VTEMAKAETLKRILATGVPSQLPDSGSIRYF